MLTTIVLLLVGVATFLTGMNMMSGGLKKATGNNVKRLFGKLKNNRLAGLGIGAATTAIIQSSAASIGILQALSMVGGVSYGIAIPIILGNIFQQLYNIVDGLVVAKYVSTEALAAVGGSPTRLIDILIGLSLARMARML